MDLLVCTFFLKNGNFFTDYLFFRLKQSKICYVYNKNCINGQIIVL
jgi:hypothetical protein